MMNLTTLILIALRASALSVALAGRAKTADHLYLLADVIEAGKATDDHMREVAEKLKSREINDDDWIDVLARIEQHSSTLQS